MGCFVVYYRPGMGVGREQDTSMSPLGILATL